MKTKEKKSQTSVKDSLDRAGSPQIVDRAGFQNNWMR